MKKIQILLAMLTMFCMAASAHAGALKSREAVITHGLDDRYNANGSTVVQFHTRGSAVAKGRRVRFSDRRIGFTGSAFRGATTEVVEFKGYADFSRRRMKLVVFQHNAD